MIGPKREKQNSVQEGLFEGMRRAWPIYLLVDFIGLYSLRISGHDMKNISTC